MDAALEFEGLFEADGGVGFGVLVAGGVADVDELVVGDFGAGAFIVSEKRAGLADTLDEAVLEAEAMAWMSSALVVTGAANAEGRNRKASKERIMAPFKRCL